MENIKFSLRDYKIDHKGTYPMCFCVILATKPV